MVLGGCVDVAPEGSALDVEELLFGVDVHVAHVGEVDQDASVCTTCPSCRMAAALYGEVEVVFAGIFYRYADLNAYEKCMS